MLSLQTAPLSKSFKKNRRSDTQLHILVNNLSVQLRLIMGEYCIVLIALSRCNRVFTRRLRLCHSHTVRRREVRKGDREGLNRVVSEQ